MTRCSACGTDSPAVAQAVTTGGQSYGFACSTECSALLWSAWLTSAAPATDPAQARHDAALALWALRRRRAEVRGTTFVEAAPRSPVELEAIRIRRSFGLDVPM